MMVMVRCGYSVAETGAAKTNRPRTASATAAMRLMIGSSLCRLLEGSLPLRNDRQQEVWRLVGGKVQRVAAGENLGVPVVRVDMQEGADAFHRVGRVGERRVAAVHFVILAPHGEPEPIAGRYYDRGRPDLDIEFDRLARLERPFLIVRVPGPVGPRLGRVELAMRGAQPAQPDRRAGVGGADESDVLAGRIDQAQHQEEVGIGGLRRHPKLGRDRSSDLEAFGQRWRAEGETVTHRLIAQRRRGRGCVEAKALSIGPQEIFRPFRARQRPLVFVAQHKLFVRMPDVERHARLLAPAGVLALEEMAEETLLQGLAVITVEMREVGIAVHLQPFLLGACLLYTSDAADDLLCV